MRSPRRGNIVDVRCPQTNNEEADDEVNLSTPVSFAKEEVQYAEVQNSLVRENANVYKLGKGPSGLALLSNNQSLYQPSR